MLAHNREMAATQKNRICGGSVHGLCSEDSMGGSYCHNPLGKILRQEVSHVKWGKYSSSQRLWSQDPFIIKDLKDRMFMLVIISINTLFLNRITIRNLVHVNIKNIFYENYIF